MTKIIHGARVVPYSSIVGGGVMLLNEAGACVAQMTVIGGDRETTNAVSEEIATMIGSTAAIYGMGPQAALDVLAERERQRSVEGWDELHDDEHRPGELACASACYAFNAFNDGHFRDDGTPVGWPWSAEWWKPSTPRRDLVKAAALAIAEIERIDRAASVQRQPLHDRDPETNIGE